MTDEPTNNDVFLESMLTSSLSRVQPDPNFVQRLHDTLTHPAQLQIEKVKKKGEHTVGWFGVICGSAGGLDIKNKH